MKDNLILKWSSIIIYVVSCIIFFTCSWFNFSDKIQEEYIEKSEYWDLETDFGLEFYDTVNLKNIIKSGKISVLDSSQIIYTINKSKYVTLSGAEGALKFYDLYVGFTLLVFVFILIMHLRNSKLTGVFCLGNMFAWSLFAFIYKANLNKIIYSLNDSIENAVSVSYSLILPIFLMFISCFLWFVYNYQRKNDLVNHKVWICSVCKNSNKEYAKFCCKCGSKQPDIDILEKAEEKKEEKKEPIKEKVKFSKKVEFNKDVKNNVENDVKQEKVLSEINLMNNKTNNTKENFIIKCPVCNVENNKSEEFCFVCGARLRH